MKNNQNKKEPTNLGNVITYIVAVVIIAVIFIGITKLYSNPEKEKEKEYARIHAISDISQNDKDIKSSLGCKTDSVTSDGIILVKCTDYGDNISVQYGSNEVWYGYMPSDDGIYSYYIDKDQDMVLSMLRKKEVNQSNNNTQTSTSIDSNSQTNNNHEGQTEIVIDNYIGKDYVNIKSSLEKLGVEVIIETTTSSNKENTIVSQSVSPGKYYASMLRGKLQFSITLKIPEVLYPDFTNGNYTINDVMNFANNNSLSLTIIKEQSELPSGTIISQSKETGTKVTTGATLKITVAE